MGRDENPGLLFFATVTVFVTITVSWPQTGGPN
jgi:hypothetical protein